MPVGVHVPTRVRVDAAALRERRADLAEALGAAAGRALAGSVENVLEPRASSARVRIGVPEFTWLGAGLGDVPSSLRDEVETLFAEVLVHAVRDAGVLDVGEAPSRPRERVAEPLDRDRYDGAAALYLLPSYDGRDVPVEVGGDAERIGPSEPTFDYVWRPLGRGREWFEVFLEKVVDFGVNPQEGELLGAIYVVEWGTWGLAFVRYPQRAIAWEGATFSGIMTSEYEAATDTWKWVESSLVADVLYEISWIGDAGPGAAEKIREVFAPAVRRTIEEKKKYWAPTVITSAVNRRLDEIVRDELAKTGVVSYLVLSGGGTDTLLRCETRFPAELRGLRLIPLSDYKELTKGKGEGVGGAGEGGAGAGAGPGGGDAGPGAIIAVPGAQPGQGRLFPSPPGSEELQLVCEPYLGEPKVSELGVDGVEMRRLIDEIARGLAIEPCEYAGTFLLNAVSALGGRAAAVAKWDPGEAESMRSTPGGEGNLGHVDFVPRPSLQIEFLAHLATVVVQLDHLNGWLSASYQQRGDLIRGDWRDEPISWLIRFHAELNRSAYRNVGWLFVATCQVVLLQLLNSSRRELTKRLGNAAFAQNFEQVLLPQLETLQDLMRAKELLENAHLIASFSVTNPGLMASAFADVRLGEARPGAATVPLPGSWTDATRAFMQALGPPVTTAPRADVYELLRQADGSYVIRDRSGRVWRSDALDTGITLRRGMLESAEPLVKQLVDLPEVIDRFRGSSTPVAQELDALLRELLWHNDNVRRRVTNTPMEAIRASAIVESYKERTVPYSRFALRGIHLLAHEQIGDFFGGSPWYGSGIDEILGTELSRREGLAVLEFGGLVLLAVVCPPAAVAAGVVVAGVHYSAAEEKKELYQGLIDPELVLSHAEVEAGLFAAKLGVVFSLLPVAAEIGAGARAAFGAGARVGVSAAGEAVVARRAGLFTVEATIAHLTRVAERGFAETFALELAKEYVEDKAFEIALRPVMTAVEKRAQAEAPVGGLERALAQVLSKAEQRAAAAAAASAAAEAKP